MSRTTTVSLFVSTLLLIALPVRAQVADDYGAGEGIARSLYCPHLSFTLQYGAHDDLTMGAVSELQRFLAGRYGVAHADLVSGYFGRLTRSYLQRFQSEQGLPAYGIAGSLTRARIAALCGTAVPDGAASLPTSATTAASNPEITVVVPVVLAPGDTGALLGSGFNASTRVYFGGLLGASTAPTSISADGRMLTFVVPRYLSLDAVTIGVTNDGTSINNQLPIMLIGR